MTYLNSRIQRVKPSATIAVKTKANELKRLGASIVDLSSGEPDTETPQHIKEAAIRAMNEGKTRYTDVTGIPELREVIAQKFCSENGISTDSKRIIVTAGGKQALYQAIDVILEPTDEVVILSPYWVSYPEMVMLSGGTPVFVEGKRENGYKIKLEDLKKALTSKTRILIINSPSNPSGTGYSESELNEIGAVLENSNILVISDEVYEKLSFKHFKFTSFAKACPRLSDRTVTVQALSKTYCMTGWRVGYATGPQEIISAMGRHQSQTTTNVNSIAQYAALAALTGPQDYLEKMVQNYERRIDKAMALLEQVPGISCDPRPDGAFYLFVHFEDFLKKHGLKIGSTELSLKLLEKGGVAVVPGKPFGDDYAFRISVSYSDDVLEDGASRIISVFNDLSLGKI